MKVCLCHRERNLSDRKKRKNGDNRVHGKTEFLYETG